MRGRRGRGPGIGPQLIGIVKHGGKAAADADRQVDLAARVDQRRAHGQSNVVAHPLELGWLDVRQRHHEAGGVVESQSRLNGQLRFQPLAERGEQVRLRYRIQIRVEVLRMIDLDDHHPHGLFDVSGERIEKLLVSRQAGDRLVAVDGGEPGSKTSGVHAVVDVLQQSSVIERRIERVGSRHAAVGPQVNPGGGQRADAGQLLGLVADDHVRGRLAGDQGDQKITLVRREEDSPAGPGSQPPQSIPQLLVLDQGANDHDRPRK